MQTDSMNIPNNIPSTFKTMTVKYLLCFYAGGNRRSDGGHHTTHLYTARLDSDSFSYNLSVPADWPAGLRGFSLLSFTLPKGTVDPVILRLS